MPTRPKSTAPLKVVPIASKAKASPWSPEQCVTEFLGEILEKKISPVKILILWFEELPDLRLRPHRWFANVSTAEEVAMLELGKQMAIEDWRNG